jgi:hypothetical protein
MSLSCFVVPFLFLSPLFCVVVLRVFALLLLLRSSARLLLLLFFALCHLSTPLLPNQANDDHANTTKEEV